jgi:hypothetical protein
MPAEEERMMAPLWLLKGEHDAPGWKKLRQAYQDEEVDIVHLDPQVWALIEAVDAPSGYDGLSASAPPDGMYLDPNGSPLYVVNRECVAGPRELIAGLGEEAISLLEQGGDPISVIERLGRAF